MTTPQATGRFRHNSRERTLLVCALPVAALAVALLAALLWYVGGGAIWYRSGGAGWLPYLLVVCIWPLRWATVGFRVRYTSLTWSLMLFVFTAAMGVWTAYDQGPALAKFGLVVGAISLCAAMAHQRRWWQVYVGLAALGGLGVALALYFLASNDWATMPVKMGPMNTVGGLLARFLPHIGGHSISPNVAGGMLASLAPSYLPLSWLAWDGWRGFGDRPRLARAVAVLWAAAGLGVLLVLLVTSSRGAWMGLFLAAAMWTLWRLLAVYARRRSRDHRVVWRLRTRWMGASLGAVVVALVGAAALILRHHLPGAASLTNRLDLYRNASLLARDYWLTGAGLGVFEMQFSIYTLLIHVGYIVNAHNILIDLVVEQGILGLVAYGGALIGIVRYGMRRVRRASHQQRWILEGLLAMVVVAAMHSLFDDVHYGSRALLFMFAPMGLILSAGRLEQRRRHGEHGRSARDWRPLAALGLGLAMVLMVGWRLLLAQAWATLGAIEQARIELNTYDQWAFDVVSMDDVRQQEDLSAPVAYLERSLSVLPSPGNRLARQRLASIELSTGGYARALELMRGCWMTGHRDSITRMLYADALVAHGRIEEAASVLAGVPDPETRLSGQAYDRYYMNGDEERAIAAWETMLLLDPQNAYPVYWLEKVRAEP